MGCFLCIVKQEHPRLDPLIAGLSGFRYPRWLHLLSGSGKGG